MCSPTSPFWNTSPHIPLANADLAPVPHFTIVANAYIIGLIGFYVLNNASLPHKTYIAKPMYWWLSPVGEQLSGAAGRIGVTERFGANLSELREHGRCCVLERKGLRP